MQSRTFTPFRIEDVVSPLSETLSPENFHLSLSSLVLGHEPVVPNRWAPVATASVSSLSSKEEIDDTEFSPVLKQPNASQEGSISGVEQSSSSEDDISSRACDKNREKYRDLNYERSKSATDTDETTSTSEAELTCDDSSSDAQPQSMKARQRRGQSATSSKRTLSNEESHENDTEASNSAGTVEDSSSRAANSTEDDSGWTWSEDAKLRGMKEDGRHPTWADISSAIRRSKKECQLRWKVLKNQSIVADAEAGSRLGNADNMTEDGMSKGKSKDERSNKDKGKLNIEKQQDKTSGRKYKQTKK